MIDDDCDEHWWQDWFYPEEVIGAALFIGVWLAAWLAFWLSS